MLGKQDLYQLVGATAYDRDGDELGVVDAVFVDNQTDEATFALVETGLFGRRSSFVPLAYANFRGGDLHVAYTADKVKDAPNLGGDDELDRDQELELYRYYEVPAVSDDTVAGATPDAASGDTTAAPETVRTTGQTPSGADLVADQGIDPMFDGPQVSAEERLRLRRLGEPASNADDALLEHGDDTA